MFDIRNSGLILAALAAGSLALAGAASAQSVYDDRNAHTLLISPAEMSEAVIDDLRDPDQSEG